MGQHRLISLLSAVALLFSGAFTAVKENDRVVGAMLMAAGLIVLGAWIVLEVRYEMHQEDERHEHGPDT